MASHHIVINNPNTSVLSKDVEFEVRSNSKKLGTMMLSKGNIEWLPAGNSVNRHRITWEKFAALMESQPTRKRVK